MSGRSCSLASAVFFHATPRRRRSARSSGVDIPFQFAETLVAPETGRAVSRPRKSFDAASAFLPRSPDSARSSALKGKDLFLPR
jgi:hypothetical protein